MQRKKPKRISLDRLNLTNPQKEAMARLLTTQKNKYKKLLHEAHERLHIIADLTQSLEFWYNINGTYEHISPSCERILGYKREEFFQGSVTLDTIVHEDSREQYRRSKISALRGDSGEDEYKVVHKDGTVRWVRALWNPVLTRRGRHIGIRVSLTDITDERASKELARNYATLFARLAGDLGGMAVFALDPDGRIRGWNAGAQQRTGYAPAVIIGSGFERLHDEQEHDPEHIQRELRALERDTAHSYMAWIRRADGSRSLTTVALTALCAADGSVHEIVGILSDADNAVVETDTPLPNRESVEPSASTSTSEHAA